MRNEKCEADEAAFNDYAGLTKREYFAAMALQGSIAADTAADCPIQKHAEFAIKIADALIAQLNSPQSDAR